MATNFVYTVTGTPNKIAANGSENIPKTGLVDLEFSSGTTLGNAQTVSGDVTASKLYLTTSKNIWNTNPVSSGQALTTDSAGNFSWTTLPINTSTVWSPLLRIGYSSGFGPQTYQPDIYLKRTGNIVTLTIDLAILISRATAVNYPINLISSNPVSSIASTVGDPLLPAGYFPRVTTYTTQGVNVYLGTLPMFLTNGVSAPTFFNATVSLVSNPSTSSWCLQITPGGYSYQTSVPQIFGADITLKYYIGATGTATGPGTVDQISSVTYTYIASTS